MAAKRYSFTITISAYGETPNEAWLEAVTCLAIDPDEAPEDYKIVEEDSR